MWVKQPRPTPSAFLSLLISCAYSSEMNYTWSFWWYHWPLTPTITVGYMKPIVALMGYLRNFHKKTPGIGISPQLLSTILFLYWYHQQRINVIGGHERNFQKERCQRRHASCRTAWWKTIPWWNRRTSSVLRHWALMEWSELANCNSPNTLNVWYIFTFIYLHFPYITLFV